MMDSSAWTSSSLPTRATVAAAVASAPAATWTDTLCLACSARAHAVTSLALSAGTDTSARNWPSCETCIQADPR